MAKLDMPTDPQTVDIIASIALQVVQKGVTTNINLSASGNVLTPASGKKLRVYGWIFSIDTDIKGELRFGETGNAFASCPTKGINGMNLIGLKPLEGGVDVPLYGYLSGTGNMKGTVWTEEV